jgi:N-acetylated-alpha-linked acidic dipeptidase
MRYSLVFALTLALPCVAAAQEITPIRGFPADALATQAAHESQLRAVPNRDSLRLRMRLLSEDPHEAGTERSRHVAELILARFKSYGVNAEIEQFEALMPRPTKRLLELVSPDTFTAGLAEKPVPGDKDSNDANQLPTYNAYSPDGDVTGDLVFVNYGIPEDYEVLDSLGISVAGKIVIAKYGRSWRGIKPKLAAEHGAIGCIIYSDPEDDGYFVNDVYPKGPMRPWHGVQRGSVMDMPTYPGDPLSPGWASEPGARKLDLADVKTLEPIPVLPISYEDALPFLRNLGGPVAPEPWRGALPITYHVGPGPAKAHLAVAFEWKSRPLYDVIARIPGAVAPDQWVIQGNHHDAWVNGANDPLSGMVALEETARSLGALLATGWRPDRTIILAAWDGEEWGLLGSTEWAEKHRAELDANGIAYLNSDTNNRGWLNVSGSHSLETFTYQLARDIHDPIRDKSALAAVTDRRASRRSAPNAQMDTAAAAEDSLLRREQRRIANERRPRQAGPATAIPMRDTTFTIGALGSGSDYTAFIDHLGLASLNLSYGGETQSGNYHSMFDSYDFYTRFSDTTFTYGVMESQTMSTALVRLADAPVLPFEFGTVARTYRRYADQIMDEARKNNELKALDLSQVRAALDQLDSAAVQYEVALHKLNDVSSRDLEKKAKALNAVNKMLYRTERALTDASGLPQRDWFRHLIYAPGFYTGYGVKTMPGIREAVEDKPNLEVAQREAGRVAAAIARMANQVESAADALSAVLR